MDINNTINSLNESLKQYGWFSGKITQDAVTPNAIVIYVTSMGLDVFEAIPSKLDGYNIKIHFESSAKLEEPTIILDNLDVEIEEEDVFDITDIHNALWNFQRICGREYMTDIFYEIVDGDDAITQRSFDYPEVRDGMEELYEEFGFDVLHDEICN